MVLPAMQLIEQRHDLIAGLRVQVAGRLVGQDDRRPVDERARNGNALPLTAGKLVRLMVHALFEVHRAQGRFRALNALLGGVPL